MPNYKTYDPQVEGLGNPAEWEAAFKGRMGLGEAKRTMGNDSPRGILGVAANATWDMIKSAYRKLVMQHHPDKGGDPAMFRKIQAAYEILEAQRV
jgi:DnaJ-domain-containing protein 1